MSPVSGIATLGVAFTAGLTLTLLVVDSSQTGSENTQRVETAAAPNVAAAATEPSSTLQIDPTTNIDNDPDLLVVASVGDDAENGPAALQSGGSIGVEATSPQAEISQTPLPGSGQSAAPDVEAAADPFGTNASTQPTAANTQPTAANSQPETKSPTAQAAPTRTPATQARTTQAPTTQALATQAQPTQTQPTQAPATIAPTIKSPTTQARTTQAPTTQAPTTKAPTTQAPTTQAPSQAAPTPSQGGSQFESIRNNNQLFNRYENVPSNQLSLNALTEPAPVPDNGAHPDGNFRMACQYSHFSYDDPIVFPGQPGKSHLHMFFGNTGVDAHTTTDSLVNSGGGSCNGFELNRSGYWTPAVLDGKGNTVVPDQLLLYYKTKDPSTVQAMPQGLKMIAGNPTEESFTADFKLGWSCGANGTSYNRTNRIPNNCGNDPVNAYIQFPFCWDGKNLDSSDHISHMAYVNDNQSCPGSHPVRLPQISILMYFPAGDTSGWYLSSDRHGGFNTEPGATLHADWFGGWNDEALDLWIDGCMTRSRNCSFGQTGTSRMFAKLNPLQNYPGNNFLPLPK